MSLLKKFILQERKVLTPKQNHFLAWKKKMLLLVLLRRGGSKTLLRGPFRKYLSSPFSKMFRRPWCICCKLWLQSWETAAGTYDLCNRATFAFQIYMNSKHMTKQSEIFNISLFSLTIFIFKMLNLNVSSLLLWNQWLWHWLNLVITAN